MYPYNYQSYNWLDRNSTFCDFSERSLHSYEAIQPSSQYCRHCCQFAPYYQPRITLERWPVRQPNVSTNFTASSLNEILDLRKSSTNSGRKSLLRNLTSVPLSFNTKRKLGSTADDLCNKEYRNVRIDSENESLATSEFNTTDHKLRIKSERRKFVISDDNVRIKSILANGDDMKIKSEIKGKIFSDSDYGISSYPGHSTSDGNVQIKPEGQSSTPQLSTTTFDKRIKSKDQQSLKSYDTEFHITDYHEQMKSKEEKTAKWELHFSTSEGMTKTNSNELSTNKLENIERTALHFPPLNASSVQDIEINKEASQLVETGEWSTVLEELQSNKKKRKKFRNEAYLQRKRQKRRCKEAPSFNTLNSLNTSTSSYLIASTFTSHPPNLHANSYMYSLPRFEQSSSSSPYVWDWSAFDKNKHQFGQQFKCSMGNFSKRLAP